MLAAKLLPPRQAETALLRNRLVDALLEHIDRKLQIVIAPAGFGKTTLLVDTVRGGAFVACWATLDYTDRDLAAFVETVVEAVRRHLPGIGGRTLAALHRVPDVERRTRDLARLFAAEVEEGATTLTVLVLDDFHEVNDSAPVTQFLDELLRVLPDSLRVVLAGRSLPNLTVSRLLVEGQLFGLGETDLRFTTAELLTLLRRRQGAMVTDEQAAAVAEGAEGWVAGFLLSAPRLWDGLLAGMIGGGSDGPLYDYFASEAFDEQSPEARRFLLATSTPDTVDAELCEALLGPGDWSLMAAEVERAGLFVTRLQSGAGAFRYHQMFRAFLQTRLRRTDLAEYRRLHARAATHLVDRAIWAPALGHLREAGEESRAAALVARIAPELERTNRWRALVDAVSSLPAGTTDSHPDLLLAGTRAALITGDLLRAESLALSAHAIAAATANSVLEARALACLGNTRRVQGRTREALDVLNRALALAPDDDELVAMVRRDIGQCLGVQGDFGAAVTELRLALAYFEQTGAMYEAARTEFPLGVVLAKAGRLPEAIARYESTLARWRQLNDAAMEAEMLNCLGCAYAYRGEFARARAGLEQALEHVRRHGYPLTESATLHSLGEVLLAGGEIDAARTAFEQGLAIAREIGELWVVTHLYDSLALTAAFAGDITRAEEHAHHAIALAQRQDSRYLEALCSLTLGAIRSRTGQSDAVAILGAAVATLAGLAVRREVTRGTMWLAQAQYAAGATAEARERLREALHLAGQLGSDGVLDLHARWDPALFVGAAGEGVEPARLNAVLARTSATRPPLPRISVVELPALAVRAFGPGSVRINDTRDVVWAWDKSMELLFLLLYRGPQRQEQVTAALWPDAPPAKAKGSLHTAVYRLRQAIGVRDVLIIRSGVYRINDEMVTLYDARDFQNLVRASGAATGDEAASLLQQAVDLVTAPFLQDIDAEWCAEERERLARLHLVALERLSTAYAAAARLHEAIAAAERLLTLDPLREDVYALLIRHQMRLNDHTAARRLVERCMTVLRDELGIEPGPEIQALAARLAA